MTKNNPHWGTTLDTFLNEDGIPEAAKAEAVTRVVARQLTQEMERQGMTEAKLAELMHTNRTQVDRILKARGNITIESLGTDLRDGGMARVRESGRRCRLDSRSRVL
jgi:antitoxin HicB